MKRKVKPCSNLKNNHEIPWILHKHVPSFILSNHKILFDCFAELKTFTDLPDGIQCVLPYDPDKILQCQLNGAIFNITTSSSNITTTSPENSSTSKNSKTTETLESLSTSRSITLTSAERSTSKNDKTTPMTSSESTESEKTIYTTSKGSTEITTSLTNGVIFLKR